MRKVAAEPARVEQLRHETDIGERRFVAEAERAGRIGEQLFAGVETLLIDAARPVVDLGVAVSQLAHGVEHAKGLHRMQVAGDGEREGANAGAQDRITRQQRRLGMGLVQVIDDRQRLRQRCAVIEFEAWHETLRIELEIVGLALVATAKNVETLVVGEPLHRHDNADAIGG